MNRNRIHHTVAWLALLPMTLSAWMAHTLYGQESEPAVHQWSRFERAFTSSVEYGNPGSASSAPRAVPETTRTPFAGFWRVPRAGIGKPDPLHPVINLEPNDDAHRGYTFKKPFDAHAVRRAAYWSLLVSPPAGVTYGAHGVWSWEPKPFKCR